MIPAMKLKLKLFSTNTLILITARKVFSRVSLSVILLFTGGVPM